MSLQYEGNVRNNTAKWAVRQHTQMWSNTVHVVHPISMISCLSPFRLTCDPNDVYYGAAILSSQFFMKSVFAAELNARLRLKPIPPSSTLTLNKVVLTTCRKWWAHPPNLRHRWCRRQNQCCANELHSTIDHVATAIYESKYRRCGKV